MEQGKISSSQGGTHAAHATRAKAPAQQGADASDAAAAGGFYLLAGVFGGSISGLMAALPLSGIQTLAGLALLGTISGSLYQALNHEAERDAAIVTFLMTASGVTLLGIGSAFWGLVLGGICYTVFSRLRRA